MTIRADDADRSVLEPLRPADTEIAFRDGRRVIQKAGVNFEPVLAGIHDVIGIHRRAVVAGILLSARDDHPAVHADFDLCRLRQFVDETAAVVLNHLR